MVDRKFLWRRGGDATKLFEDPEVPMTIVLVLAAVFVALRLLAAAGRPRASPARALYERRLRQGPI